MEKLNLGEAMRHHRTPTKASSTLACPEVVTSSPGGRLKMTLRMKRSPMLDEVIEQASRSISEEISQSTPKKKRREYEVLKMEYVEDEVVPRQALKREPDDEDDSTKPRMKRLKLKLGSEVSTIQLIQ